MPTGVALEVPVTDDPKDEAWQRLISKLRYVEVGETRTQPAPMRPRKRSRIRNIGGYFSRLGALTDQQRKWNDYTSDIASGKLLEDEPSIQGFARYQHRGRTTLWRIYLWWGLLWPPGRGLDPDWTPIVEEGWIPPS